MALDAGADFLKTSTGKTPRSATPEAATVLLQAIAADRTARATAWASSPAAASAPWPTRRCTSP
jgi:deoxyribose-phosphate aldolase